MFFPTYLLGTFKIITGNGDKIIYNSTIKFMKDHKIKYKSHNGYLFIFN